MTLRFVETLANMLLREFFRVPRPAMMPTPTMAAIRPYSMAVAPDSSFTKRAKMVCILVLSKKPSDCSFNSVEPRQNCHPGVDKTNMHRGLLKPI